MGAGWGSSWVWLEECVVSTHVGDCCQADRVIQRQWLMLPSGHIVRLEQHEWAGLSHIPAHHIPVFSVKMFGKVLTCLRLLAFHTDIIIY